MIRKTILALLLSVATFSIAVAQHPRDLSTINAGEVGLSHDGLQQITEYLQREVDEGRIAGAVAAVSRYGRVGYLQAVGNAGLEPKQPMRTDVLFRIASMTKVITSAAVMSLVEDGTVSLDDPLSKHLPGFAEIRVLKSVEGDSTESVPAKREPTIRDLLVHRSGLTYGWFGPEKLDAIYTVNAIQNLFEPTAETIGDRVDRVATVPLKFHPGTDWDYSVSTDVLGRVVEVASGLTLDQFFRERFFRPLKMQDTFFYVPVDKQARLAGLFTLDENKRLKSVADTPVQVGFLRFSADYCTQPGRFYSGGGGLVSSTLDYVRFLHMLLGGGELDGVRVLKRETVSMMTQNHIGEMTIPFPGHGDGFGFGFGVVTDRGLSTDEFSVGTFSWGGIFNTYFRVDPQEELVGVLMTQLFPNDHLSVRENFRKLAYAAIDDSGFEQLYHYRPGDEHANPSFNGRELRVNAAEVSTHPEFAARSESRSSGMARIRVDEDLRTIRRVDLDTEVWGGHPGTSNKRVTINGRSTHLFPDVGSAQNNCTHQYSSFNLRPIDLVNGYNSLQFACDTGNTFWGHFIVDRATLRIGLTEGDERLGRLGLKEFNARVTALPLAGEKEGFELSLDIWAEFRNKVANVLYQARHFGYDENGNGWRTDWHDLDGTTFDSSMIPAQKRVEVRAVVEFTDALNLRYRTASTRDLTIEQRRGERVRLFASCDLPRPFWSRDNRIRECTVDLDVDPKDISAAELHVVAWTGGPGDVADYFTLNGKHLAIADGKKHETVYSRVVIEPTLLRRGENKFVLRSDTKHHGIEILLPGPALMVRHREVKASEPEVSASIKVESARDESAGSLDCFRITTPTATVLAKQPVQTPQDHEFRESNEDTVANEEALRSLEQFALTQQGDPQAGAKLFQDQRTKCATCHRIGKEGRQVGPDLSSIGGKFDRPHLIDALLYPSRQIGYGYETTTVVTDDGKVISGIAIEADDTHLTLLDANNNRNRIAKADINESMVSKTSIMPVALAALLSQQEFTDLIAFLETLGAGNGRMGSGVSGPMQLPAGFQLNTVATGLSGAVAMEVASDGRIFVCEQGGTLRVIKDGTLLENPFATVPVEMNWERGLIGVTLAPNFPTDPYVYLVYVAAKPYTHHRISRFRADGDIAIAGSEEILFRGDDQSKFGGNVPAGHQGGAIHFGPDGKLYIGLGEQTAGIPAQRMDALQGKILRLNPDGSIPADNPFIKETTGKYQAIWAKGCRNPFTFAFSKSGEMLINDVGGQFEEINCGVAGANYGWPGVEHGPSDQAGITDPIHFYPQSSINGGDFCSESTSWPTRFHGQFFFADFVHGWVKYIDPNNPKESHEFLSGIRRPVDLRFAPDGSLYVLLRNAWVVDKNFVGGTGSLVKISRM